MSWVTKLKHVATASQPGEIWDIGKGRKLGGVHLRAACEGACVIHNPSQHTMTDFPLLWREDRAIFERICPHGVGHPDPDQFGYWKRTGQTHQITHGCDGCCG